MVINIENINEPFIDRTDNRMIASVTSCEIALWLVGPQLMHILNLRLNLTKEQTI